MTLELKDNKIYYNGKYGENVVVATNCKFKSVDEWKIYTKDFLESNFDGINIQDKIRNYLSNYNKDTYKEELDIYTYNIFIDIFREWN